jgi:hypothetical protein
VVVVVVVVVVERTTGGTLVHVHVHVFGFVVQRKIGRRSIRERPSPCFSGEAQASDRHQVVRLVERNAVPRQEALE